MEGGNVGLVGVEEVKEKMEQLAKKQTWIRREVSRIMGLFEEKVIPENLERFRFRYKIGVEEYDYENRHYYFYIDEGGTYIRREYDYSDIGDNYRLTDEDKLKDIPIWVLRNLGREFPNILKELSTALENANKCYGEAVERLRKLEEALASL